MVSIWVDVSTILLWTNIAIGQYPIYRKQMLFFPKMKHFCKAKTVRKIKAIFRFSALELGQRCLLLLHISFFSFVVIYRRIFKCKFCQFHLILISKCLIVLKIHNFDRYPLLAITIQSQGTKHEMLLHLMPPICAVKGIQNCTDFWLRNLKATQMKRCKKSIRWRRVIKTRLFFRLIFEKCNLRSPWNVNF